MTETLGIDWESDEPRVLWDGGKPAGESSYATSYAASATPTSGEAWRLPWPR